MPRSRIVFLAFCLVFRHAVGAAFEDISNREDDLLERLLNVLKAEKKETSQEETCSIESVDDLFYMCLGKQCMYRLFDKNIYIEFTYYQRKSRMKLKVFDLGLNSLASTTGSKLPLSLTFPSGDANYKVTVTDVTPVDKKRKDISACLDLEKI